MYADGHFNIHMLINITQNLCGRRSTLVKSSTLTVFVMPNVNSFNKHVFVRIYLSQIICYFNEEIHPLMRIIWLI